MARVAAKKDILIPHLAGRVAKEDSRGLDRRLTAVLQTMRLDGTVAAVVKKYGLKTW